MNAREQLAAVADWLGWTNESLSCGLRNAFDGLRLYDYAQRHPELEEMPDSWDASHRITAIGYDPLAATRPDSTSTGAEFAADAIQAAYDLIDSVAFVKDEGDTERPLAMLSKALGD